MSMYNANISNSEILNSILASAQLPYFGDISMANTEADVKRIGLQISQNPGAMNEFISILGNKVMKTIYSTKMAKDFFANFWQGIGEEGAVVEEICTNPIAPSQWKYVSELSNNDRMNMLMGLSKPEIGVQYYLPNYRVRNKVSISSGELIEACSNVGGLQKLVGELANAMYSGMYFSHYACAKYCLLKGIANMGHKVYLGASPSNTDIIKKARELYMDAQYMRTDYNFAKMMTYMEDANFLITPAMDAEVSVDVLANAFNMDKTTFLGKKLSIDSFSINSMEEEYIRAAYDMDDNETLFTDAEETVLENCKFVLFDPAIFRYMNKALKSSSWLDPTTLLQQMYVFEECIIALSPFKEMIVLCEGTEPAGEATVTYGAIAAVEGAINLPTVTGDPVTFKSATIAKGSGEGATAGTVSLTKKTGKVTLTAVPTVSDATVTVTYRAKGAASDSTATFTVKV